MLANSGGGLDALEVNKDVVGLLVRLREMAFVTGGIQELFVTLTDSFRHIRFIVSAKLLIGHWSKFIHPSWQRAQARVITRMK
jgi:hypothetical protein